MLSGISHSLHKAMRDDFEDEDPCGGMYAIDLAHANSARLARLDSFAGLCVGGAGHAALTPGRALSLVRAALAASHKKWEAAYDDEEERLAETDTVEACLSALVRTELTGGGDRDDLLAAAFPPPPPALLRFEAELAAELAARGAEFPGDYADTFDEAPRTTHKRERTRKRIEQILASLRAQITALAPSQSLSAPTVVPLALSDADFMPGALFGDGTNYNDNTWFSNDHNGHLTYACVAEAWVVLVCMKVGSC